MWDRFIYDRVEKARVKAENHLDKHLKAMQGYLQVDDDEADDDIVA